MQKEIFEQEVHIAFFNLLDVILNQMQFEISQKKRKNCGQTNYNYRLFTNSTCKSRMQILC